MMTICNYCKQEGHWVRKCPLLEERRRRGEAESWEDFKKRKDMERHKQEEQKVKSVRRMKVVTISDTEEEEESESDYGELKGLMANVRKTSKRPNKGPEPTIIKKKKNIDDGKIKQSEDKVIKRKKKSIVEVNLAVID